MDIYAAVAIIGSIAAVYAIYSGKQGVQAIADAVGGAVSGTVEETSDNSTPVAGIDKSKLAGVIVDPPGGGTINVSVFGKTFPVTYKLAYSGEAGVSGNVDIHVTQISLLGKEYERVTSVPAVYLPGGGVIVQQTINAEVANGLEIDLAYGMTVFVKLFFSGIPLNSTTVKT